MSSHGFSHTPPQLKTSPHSMQILASEMINLLRITCHYHVSVAGTYVITCLQRLFRMLLIQQLAKRDGGQ